MYDIDTLTGHDEIDYGSLMSRRIGRILLICSSFDLFSLEEEGRVEAQINTEYNELNLNNPPTFVHAPDARRDRKSVV